MAVKQKSLTRRLRRRFRRVVIGGTTRLINPARKNKPTPPASSSTHNQGVLRLNTGTLKLPPALAEVGETQKRGWMPGPVVIAIIVFVLAFIAFITWQIAGMPEK